MEAVREESDQVQGEAKERAISNKLKGNLKFTA